MKTDYSDYQNNLEELVELLRTYNEDYWANYFRKSLELLYKGKPQKSIKHSLGAYGGMSSFNDSLYFMGNSVDRVYRHRAWYRRSIGTS